MRAYSGKGVYSGKGAYLSAGAYSRKYDIPQFTWGHIRSRDAFRPFTRDQQFTNREASTALCSVVKQAESG